MHPTRKTCIALILVLSLISSCQNLAQGEHSLPTDSLTGGQSVVDSEMTAEQEAQVFSDWIREHHQPIRSLTAEATDDLDFLEPYLRGKRLVQLGEMAHGVAELNALRTRLIKYLHEVLGYDVIAFESSVFECAYLETSDLSARDKLLASLFGVWHTEEVLALFEYVQSTQTTDRPLHLVGFDVQISSLSTAAALRPQFLKDVVSKVDVDYGNRVFELDTEVLNGIAASAADGSYWDEHGPGMVAEYEALVTFLDAHMETLLAQFPETPQLPLLTRQTAWSTARYVQALQADDFASYLAIRDQSMADNVDFILDRLYPGAKVVLWAHNAHIRYANEQVVGNAAWQGQKTMGAWIAERHPGEVYTIGGYAYSGQVAQNDQQVIEIPAAMPGSLESILHQASEEILFVDFSRQVQEAGNGWMFREIPAHEFADVFAPLKMVPRDQYDAVLFIEKVTPPRYLY